MKNWTGEGVRDGLICGWEGGYGKKKCCNLKVVILKFIVIKRKFSIKTLNTIK